MSGLAKQAKVRTHLLAALAVLAGALAPGAATLGAQATRPAAERLERRLDASTRAVVLALVDSARLAGLPTEPLVDKALEGASKGAAGSRIVLALRTLSAELGAARLALGAQASEPEIAAAAGALHIGVRAPELARLRRARGRQPLTVALGVVSDLVARGVPADSATAAVLTLADARLGDDELVEFRRTVERDIALGAPPAAAASVRVGGFTGPLSASDGLPGSGNIERSNSPRPRRP